MSELDLGLKCGVRSLLWGMGFSTRLDVELRGTPAPAGATRSRSAETYTDLDVLGVNVSTLGHATTVIADCKSGRHDKPTARMFWLRGVADFFQADRAMLVREHDVNDGTRQLAARLRIDVLAPQDLLKTQELYPAAVESDGPLAVLFDRAQVASHLSAFTGLDRRLAPLLEYAQFDYWLYDRHRNPTQLVAHLRESGRLLDARNPVHRGLLFDLAWEYILTLVYVIEHIRGAFVNDLDRGLQEYLFGGPLGLREKLETAAMLRTIAPRGERVEHLPPYYGQLRELVTRLLRRPAATQTMLRYAEAAAALTLAKQPTALPDAFAGNFQPVAAKLTADVVGFLVAAGDLDPHFRSYARTVLMGEISATSPAARTAPEARRPDGNTDQETLELVPSPAPAERAPHPEPTIPGLSPAPPPEDAGAGRQDQAGRPSD